MQTLSVCACPTIGAPAVFTRCLTPFAVQHRPFAAPSPLVRLLADTASVPPDVARHDFAEQLSLWLGAVDAVVLHATHQSLKAEKGSSPLGATPFSPEALQAHVQAVRAALVARVCEPVPAADEGPDSGQLRAHPPHTGAEALADAGNPDVGFAPFRQHCLGLQHHMALKIATLRAQVRQVLAHADAPMRQLAELDAVWEQLLAPREQKLFSAVPALLEKRHAHLQATAGLGRYAHEHQAALLAELNVRLLPVVGLVEAFASQADQNELHT